MKIMVCNAYLFDQLVGVYPDSRKQLRSQHLAYCSWRLIEEHLIPNEIAGFQNRVYDFFANLFGTKGIKVRLTIQEIEEE